MYDMQIWIIIVICAAIVWLTFKGWKQGTESSSATIVTILGIFGTFLGIFLGLLSFDVANITESISNLLAGMKLAFVTSIFGMGGGLALKFTAQNRISKDINRQNTDVTSVLNQMAGSLKDLVQIQKKTNNNMEEAVDKIKTLLAGDGDSTILTQLQKLRMTFTDKQNETIEAIRSVNEIHESSYDKIVEMIKSSHKLSEKNWKKLIEEFTKFSDHMVEQNSKAIVEALSNVIRDFNDKITEQFGDNFKELNKAVSSLLEWQENYKEQVEQNEKLLKQVAASLEWTEESTAKIAEQCGSIVKASEALNEDLITVANTHTELEEHLQQFAKMSEDAEKSIEDMKESLVTSTDSVRETIEESFKVVVEACSKNHESISNQTEALDKVMTSAVQAYDQISEDNQKLLEILSSQLKLQVENMEQELQKVTNKTSGNIENMVNESNRMISEQVVRIDRTLEEELTKSISSLGTQLAALSSKFVDDYQPLTEKLQRLVEISQRIEE